MRMPLTVWGIFAAIGAHMLDEAYHPVDFFGATATRFGMCLQTMMGFSIEAAFNEICNLRE